MNIEEKLLILAGLLHDIGKFRQRCFDEYDTHQYESEKFIKEHRDLFEFILDSGANNKENQDLKNVDKLIYLVRYHHDRNEKDELLDILKEADHLSASERVEKELDEDKKIVWGYDYLCSLNSKINLNSDYQTPLRFYKHSYLTKKNYDVLIPKEKNNIGDFKYKKSDWFNFIDDFKTIMLFYETEKDFNTLINLLLIVFEKYLWCIPDFTGSEETDISLYNHLKDVAGLALSIYRTKKDDISKSNLVLLAGDIPGIQNYITDINKTRAAKILRGRSIYIQILSRMFASVFLEEFDLPENNLIMLAGGKFYIILPDLKDFSNKYNSAKNKIEKYLIKVFHYDLKFISATASFNYLDLKRKKITFGEVIEEVEQNLLKEKSTIFKNIFFNKSQNIDNNFIISKEFITNFESDRVKCSVTDKPMFEGEVSKILPLSDDDSEIEVSSQVKKEYLVGDKITDNNIVIEFENDNLTIDEEKIYDLKEIKNRQITESRKILLNPDLDEMLDIKKGSSEVVKRLKNCSFIDVANYCTKFENRIMDFEKMSEQNDGAKYLTLIKGDVDNLGLIMAFGLRDDEYNLTAISRTTTFSNHYKYFFSFFLNGFLKDNYNGSHDACVYTIYAGGDDIVFVCPQSRALELIKNFNDTFRDFTCNNKEIHLSYSITHFKHSTPIRLVVDFAESNQHNAKRNDLEYKDIENVIKYDKKCFFEEKNKASLFIFDTVIKNTELEDLIKYSDKLVKWGTKSENGKEEISAGILRNLFTISELIKQYKENKDTSKLMWHPLLTYSINRNLKDKNGNFKSKDEELAQFFYNVLSINKDNEQAKKIERILYPAVCTAIYKLRNK